MIDFYFQIRQISIEYYKNNRSIAKFRNSHKIKFNPESVLKCKPNGTSVKHMYIVIYICMMIIR